MAVGAAGGLQPTFSEDAAAEMTRRSYVLAAIVANIVWVNLIALAQFGVALLFV